jgi:Tol biopolymer transport system component
LAHSGDGGTPQPIAGIGAGTTDASIAPKGNRLAYVQALWGGSIRRFHLQDTKHLRSTPFKLTAPKGYNVRPNFSPDGTRIAFESDRYGPFEIWACDADGSNCDQLTSLHGTAGAPRWSPDGRQVAFEFGVEGHSEIYVVDVPGGLPRKVVTFPGANNGGPNWSRDGKWIYFSSDRTGEPYQIWKIPAQGGAPVQVTRNGGVFATESSDGRFLYFSKFEIPGVWRMPLQGGEETRVFDQPDGQGWYNWALTEDGIYFIDWNTFNVSNVKFFEFATGKVTLMTTLEKPALRGISISPDRKSILVVQLDLTEQDIMLLNNFR